MIRGTFNWNAVSTNNAWCNRWLIIVWLIYFRFNFIWIKRIFDVIPTSTLFMLNPILLTVEMNQTNAQKCLSPEKPLHIFFSMLSTIWINTKFCDCLSQDFHFYLYFPRAKKLSIFILVISQQICTVCNFYNQILLMNKF